MPYLFSAFGMNRFRIWPALLLTGTLWLSQAPTLRAQKQYTVESAKVAFTIRNMGLDVNGTLSNLKADILFAPDALDKSNIRATVDVETINTGIGMRDKHLKEPEYFWVAQFPQIIMQSTGFQKVGNTTFVGSFNLTIKGKTKEIMMPFEYFAEGTYMAFKGTFNINRLDFGLGDKSLTMADDVKVVILVKAKA